MAERLDMRADTLRGILECTRACDAEDVRAMMAVWFGPDAAQRSFQVAEMSMHRFLVLRSDARPVG